MQKNIPNQEVNYFQNSYTTAMLCQCILIKAGHKFRKPAYGLCQLWKKIYYAKETMFYKIYRILKENILRQGNNVL